MKKTNKLKLVLFTLLGLVLLTLSGCKVFSDVKSQVELETVALTVIDKVFVSNCSSGSYSEEDYYCFVNSDLNYIYEYEGVKFSYQSSDESIVTNDGKVNIDTKDHEIDITVSYYLISNGEINSQLVVSILVVGDKNYNPLNKYMDKVSFPETISSNLILPTKESIGFKGEMYFESSDQTLLSNEGEIKTVKEDTFVTFTVKLVDGDNILVRPFTIKLEKNYVKPTDLEVVNSYLDSLVLPLEILSNTKLDLIDGLSYSYKTEKYLLNLTYISSDVEVISNTGVVRLPLDEKTVDFEVKCQLNDVVVSKVFQIKVAKEVIDEAKLVKEAFESLSLDSSYSSNITLVKSIDVTYRNRVFTFDVEWKSSSDAVNSDGVINQTLQDQKVTLTAIAKGVEKEFEVVILKRSLTDLEVLEKLTETFSLSLDEANNYVFPTSLSVNDNYNDKTVELSYVSSNSIVISNEGIVNPKTTDTKVSIEVTFSLNDSIVTKTYQVVVLKRSLNASEVLSEAVKLIDYNKNVNSDLDLVNEVTVTFEGLSYNVKVSYTTSDSSVVDNSGKVTLDILDRSCNLTSTFSYDGLTVDEVYVVTVKARNLTDSEVTKRVCDEITFNQTVSEDLDFASEYIYTFNNVSYKCDLTYVSSNQTYITNEGIVYQDETNHNVLVTLEVRCGDIIKTKNFNFKVLRANDEVRTLLENVSNNFSLDLEVDSNLELVYQITENDKVINVTYKSNRTDVLDNNGVINKQTLDTTVKFDVTFEYQDITKTKTFNIKVLARNLNSSEVLEEAKAQINFENEVSESLLFNENIEVVFNNKSYMCFVTYSSSNTNVISNTGEVNQLIDDCIVRVSYTITYLEESINGYSNIKVVARQLNSDEVFDAISDSITYPDELSSDIELLDSKTYTYNNNSYTAMLSYTSSDSNVIDNTGKVNRQITDKVVTIEITISYENEVRVITKDIKVLKRALNEDEAVNMAKELFTLCDMTTSDLEFLPTYSFEFESLEYLVNLSYVSSNTLAISNSGKVTRLDDDTTVTVSVTFEKDGYSQTKEYSIIVIKEERLTQDQIDEIVSGLEIPLETHCSIEFITVNETYPDLVYTYTSSNPLYLTNEGVYSSPLEAVDVTIQVTLTFKNKEVYSENYVIRVIPDSYLIVDYATDFDGIPTKTTYGVVTTSQVVFTNARTNVGEAAVIDESNPNSLDNNYLRGRTRTGEIFTIETEYFNNLKGFKFDLFKPGSSYESLCTIKIYTKTSQTDYVLVDTVSVNLASFNNFKNKTVFEYKLERSTPTSFKLEFVSSKELQVGIDNFEVYRDINAYDFDKYLMSNIPSSTSKSISLPTTTNYGGVISYVSSNPSVLTNTGEVLSIPAVNTQVQLTATINHLGKIYVSSIYVTVLSDVGGVAVEIFFIDIGKYGQSDCGECIYIRYGDIDILVDAADSHNASKKAVNEAINLYLQDDAIDYVIATHPDADHIGGMPQVFEDFKILNCIIFDGSHTSQKYSNFVNSYTNEGCNVINIYEDLVSKKQMTLRFSQDVYIEFMDTKYYDAQVSKETNGRSIVFVLNAYSTRVLFTGDADNGSGHTNLEANYQDICGNIDILKVVHHGTKEGSSPQFLKAVDPEVAIICNGNYLGNKHSHPHVETIKNLYSYDSNMKVYCITGGGDSDECEVTPQGGYECTSTSYMQDRNGTIHVTINMEGYTIESEYFASNPIEIKDTVWWKGYLRTVGAN